MVDWSTAVSALYTMHLKRRAALQLSRAVHWLGTMAAGAPLSPHTQPSLPASRGNYSAEIELTSTLDHLLTSIAARSQI